jgi:hypothetical protein
MIFFSRAIPSLFLFSTQMASSSAQIEGEAQAKKQILSQRRCIILAIVGATPSSNAPLQSILQIGFLRSVKTWMDDILSGSVGELVVAGTR